MPKRSAPTADDHDKLVRQAAGSYRTADERFEVRQADQGWYLVDSHQTDDLGQELVRGPFATLTAVRAAIPPARSDKVVPLPRRVAPSPRQPKRAAPAPAPPSWLDRLAPRERKAAERAIDALAAAGVDDAEALVRRDREGLLPAVATALIEARLAPLLAGATDRDLLRRVVELLVSDGHPAAESLPGWMLVEIGPEPAPPNRRIEL